MLNLIFSANFKKVSQLASCCPLVMPSVDMINECVSNLVDTHPVLVLRWCQVLQQLKYMDAQFWCGFLDTGSRLSTGKNYSRSSSNLSHQCACSRRGQQPKSLTEAKPEDFHTFTVKTKY